jgi:hypothetical protein
MTVQPYSIQRGKILRGYSPTDRFSRTVRTDYMGSSEFEYGALPASLRGLQAASPRLSLLTVEEVRDERGNPLLVYGDFVTHDPDAYRAMITEVAFGRARTREYTGFKDQISPAPIVPSHRCRTKKQKQEYIEDEIARRTNFWWDIDNHVMMSFDAAYMADLPSILQASWAYMDEQSAVSVS